MGGTNHSSRKLVSSSACEKNKKKCTKMNSLCDLKILSSRLLPQSGRCWQTRLWKASKSTIKSHIPTWSLVKVSLLRLFKRIRPRSFLLQRKRKRKTRCILSQSNQWCTWSLRKETSHESSWCLTARKSFKPKPPKPLSLTLCPSCLKNFWRVQCNRGYRLTRSALKQSVEALVETA